MKTVFESTRLSPEASTYAKFSVICLVAAALIFTFGNLFDAIFMSSLAVINIGAMFDTSNRRTMKGWRRYFYFPALTSAFFVLGLAILIGGVVFLQ